MPIVLSQKQRIHYFIEGDHGPYLMLYTPFPDSIKTWYRCGYVEPLAENYRLILVDPLGQGKSDYSEDLSHYFVPSRVEHILCILNELGVERTHFLTFGVGAQVGYQLAFQAPERLRTLVIGGAHPYPVATDLSKYQHFLQVLREQGMEAFLNLWFRADQLSEIRRLELLLCNPLALAFALEALIQWTGLGQELTRIYTNTILFTETREDKFLAVREAGRVMPHARYQILPEMSYHEGLLAFETISLNLYEFYKKQR